MSRNWFHLIIIVCLVMGVSGAVFAQDDTELDFGETVTLVAELTEVSIPDGWTSQIDEEAGFLFMLSEELALEIQIYDSLEQSDALEIDVDTAADEAMVAAYDGLFGLEISADEIEIEEVSDDLTVSAIEFSENNITFLAVNTEVESVFLVDVYNLEQVALTEEQLAIVQAVIETVVPAGTGAEPQQVEAEPEPCTVSIDTDGTARLHVGPGVNRAAIAFLPAGEYEPEGQAAADDGSTWFRLNKDEAAPNTSAAEIWVAASSVATAGDCGEIVIVDAAPVNAAPAASAQSSSKADPAAETTTTDNSAAPAQSDTATDGGAAPAQNNTDAAAAPAAPVLLDGTYTLFFGAGLPVSCDGQETIVLESSQLNLSSRTFQVSTAGNTLFMGSDVLTLQPNGTYYGTYAVPGTGNNSQLYLSRTSNSSLQGQLILNFNIEGVNCSATASVSLTQ